MTSRTLLLSILVVSAATLPATAPPPVVSPVEWSTVSAKQVSDAHAYRPYYPNGPRHSLAYYLGHLHRLANAVVDDPPYRGFIDLQIWRRPIDNRPHNARIMENITSLAWFYSRDEPWNPYFADPALRLRLEEAMRFWVSIQSRDGRFSEYGEERWNLAATAFATKFMAETLVLLEGAPPIDPAVHRNVQRALRAAIVRTLEGNDLWRFGASYTNQYGNAFAGALGYLHLFEDREMEKALERRLRSAEKEFVSPAGFLYEADGPDWSYYFGTHHSNLQMAWHYGRSRPIRGTEAGTERAITFGAFLKNEYDRTTEWLAYNAVPQPDGGIFFLNRAVESRQRQAAFRRLETPLSEVVPKARAFHLTREERGRRLEWSRRELAEEWGDPPPLEVGEFIGYSPYAFLHRAHEVWYPGESERRAAQAELPYFASERFVHQRVDDRKGQVFTYVRRPAYYLAFNSGPLHREGQRRGIGLIWHPQHGTLLQSQTDSHHSAWGTRIDDTLWESRDLPATFLVDGRAIEPQVGIRDLPDGELNVVYPMPGGRRELRFGDRVVTVAVTGSENDGGGSFVEQIPLLTAPGDQVRIEEDRDVVLRRNGEALLRIVFAGETDAALHRGNTIEGLTVVTVHAVFGGDLVYEMHF